MKKKVLIYAGSLILCVGIVAGMIVFSPSLFGVSGDNSGVKDGANAEVSNGLPNNVSAEGEIYYPSGNRAPLDAATDREQMEIFISMMIEDYTDKLELATKGYENPKKQRDLQDQGHLTVAEFKTKCEIQKRWWAIAVENLKEFETMLNTNKFETADDFIDTVNDYIEILHTDCRRELDRAIGEE